MIKYANQMATDGKFKCLSCQQWFEATHQALNEWGFYCCPHCTHHKDEWDPQDMGEWLA